MKQTEEADAKRMATMRFDRRSTEEQEAKLMVTITAFVDETARLEAAHELTVEGRAAREQGLDALSLMLDKTQQRIHEMDAEDEFGAPVRRFQLDFASTRDDALQLAKLVARLRSSNVAEFLDGLAESSARRATQRPEINIASALVPDLLVAYREAPKRFGDRATDVQSRFSKQQRPSARSIFAN